MPSPRLYPANAVLAIFAIVAACAVAPPAPPPPSAAPQPTETAPTAKSHVPAPAAEVPKIPAKRAVDAAAPPKSAPAAKPAAAPKPAAPVAAKAAPAAAPPAPVAAAPAAAPPALDLKSLEQKLRETKAIGLMTKLAVKNQVDDLVSQFRAFHAGRQPPTLPELRRPYELLLMKLLSLLQDQDPGLAKALHDSREAIWGLLSDRDKFAQIA